MNLTISGHQLEVTDALRNYARVKAQRLTDNQDKVLDAHMILGTEKLAQYAEATVNLRGKTLFAKAEGQDVYAAIDGLIDKLDRQLVRHKERAGDHRGADHFEH
ncbi:MAG: ribosome-associated translation inhibitor RaiA [Xanthomonadales bacterium]|nr:Ribosome hibernation promoting factor [Xanthomonadales bacterium]MCC6593242.1 ribosome-associated translation inhibitor RaiA [Xanthomonadales bacterium]MCE7929861.1 ribosome-associated translation inhibitor RaiA [Xanthomonadales bacterium PRO6]